MGLIVEILKFLGRLGTNSETVFIMAKRNKVKDDDERPPVRCFDCIWCPKTGYWETYWSREDGPHYCNDCGQELTERNAVFQ